LNDGSKIRKRSVLISGHSTSVSLEEDFWDALKNIAATRGRSMNELISELDRNRAANLSSTIRIFVLREIIAGR
jgi:predicted DNA-binding ribbon-helix-helix protein